MDEEEHEVYGGDIPDEGEMEGDMEAQNVDIEMLRAEDDAAKSLILAVAFSFMELQELDEMKKRLKEMEEEAAALREMQAKVEKEMGAGQVAIAIFIVLVILQIQDPASAVASQANREEVDARSVFVGNVDYACTPEEVQQHFQSCGTVNRVTILTDKFGQPKGFAYVEFIELEAIQEALNLNESELHGRQLKVLPKRTNVPGLKQFRPRRFNPYLGYRFRRPYFPPFLYSPYGYGKFPRFRRPMRYRPYA
ncbi:putative polyadenylate-binding protein [Apostasia shenzhenica]|uniref:Putative polyadenylate-binding protein n=1 Tax=Apostasia shenzhenica TaxID=1088818 RepID=A0A2I0A1V4_9ASPA|nr:putative polyadenylate-binding protein [Apostasia shenzhenica]